jgi:hypothetical protein
LAGGRWFTPGRCVWPGYQASPQRSSRWFAFPPVIAGWRQAVAVRFIVRMPRQPGSLRCFVSLRLRQVVALLVNVSEHSGLESSEAGLRHCAGCGRFRPPRHCGVITSVARHSELVPDEAIIRLQSSCTLRLAADVCGQARLLCSRPLWLSVGLYSQVCRQFAVLPDRLVPPSGRCAAWLLRTSG